MHHARPHEKTGIGVITHPRFDVDIDENAGRIRCPFCEWTPERGSRWYCSTCPEPEGFLGGCGTMWNTFDTRGLCPGCSHQWVWTSCHACYKWSLHEDWYEHDDDRSS